MAIKTNNNQQGGKRKPNDYFTQSIQIYGENFLQYKTANDLQMDAVKVFRGLARGNISIDRYGCYFLDSQFMGACIQTAYSKSVYYNISFNGVNVLKDNLLNLGQIPDPNIIMVLDHHKKCAEAYNIILSGLNNVKTTGDINYLVVLANNLSDYRNFV